LLNLKGDVIIGPMRNTDFVEFESLEKRSAAEELCLHLMFNEVHASSHLAHSPRFKALHSTEDR
jgi:hypothetical protein